MNNIRDICNNNVSNNKNIIQVSGYCENKYDYEFCYLHSNKAYLEICDGCKSFMCSACITFDNKTCVNCVKKNISGRNCSECDDNINGRICKKCEIFIHHSDNSVICPLISDANIRYIYKNNRFALCLFCEICVKKYNGPDFHN